MKPVRLLSLLLLCAIPSIGVCDAPREFDWGPIASRYVDINDDLRLRAIGPIFEKTRSPGDHDLWGVRPLYMRVTDPAAGLEYHDFLWPIGATRKVRDEYVSRWLFAYYWNHDLTNPDSHRRFWMIPFLFTGRTDELERYFAVFPIGGTIQHILLRDKVSFVLFPVYSEANIGPVKTRNYLWPFVSRTEGKGIYRFRVFPFYGQAKHRERFRKKFVMWPFWTSSEFMTPGSAGSGYIFFPFYGHIELEDQESWLVLPPFFRFSRGERLNLTYCPWPFFQKTSGETEKLYLWPLWGRKRTPGTASSFFLWPIFGSLRTDKTDSLEIRHQMFPILRWEKEISRNADPSGDVEPLSRYVKLWPLFSYQREGDRSRTRCLELWPRRINQGPIERSFAPLWTVWNRVRVGEATESELLWGLYRNRKSEGGARKVSVFPFFEWAGGDTGEDVKEWSIFKGLLGYRRDATQKSFRLLYFLRLGDKGEEQ